ncbi:hypothetical protein LWC34_21620 [Kibdelosporangium philippinense]|uniref:Lipoprotein LprG n=1 Tax=Kibdelosporangium philippinense TaxID=211113 RepID=A0ABS8ZD72_9PSEU|nr:hypothetical protein [Kibdelosporangium philippinense]MCE7005407.1 hypothetical protein [Kibdelosporangium philippinense]
MKRLVILSCLLLTACGGPRALSSEEATRLAGVRVVNHSARVVGMDARVPTAGGALRLVGRLDFAARTGEATLSTEGRTDEAAGGSLQWNPSSLAVRQGGDWQYRPLQQGAELDTVLILLTSITATQPDQVPSSARWLRSDSVAGVAVDVFDTGSLTYWVDSAGRLMRLDAKISDQTATITFKTPS